jgi:hypothetical protein
MIIVALVAVLVAVFAADTNSTFDLEACTGSSRDLEPSQCAAWQDLFASTGGSGWVKCSGNKLDPCSCANGTDATVTYNGGQITYLQLYNNSLKGTISNSVGGMASLQRFNLGENDLTGTIPASLAKLKRLSSLNLASNKLTGTVPPLPFAQYTDICWLKEPWCNSPNCNSFTCPLVAQQR